MWKLCIAFRFSFNYFSGKKIHFRPTFVHRFIVLNTIEETIYNTISNDSTGKWQAKDVTVQNLEELFILKNQQALDDVVYKC